MLDRNESAKGCAMGMKRGIVLAFISCSFNMRAQSGAVTISSQKQTALITFVDNKMSLLGGLPGHKSEAFRGKLFVGDELFATLTPGHFVTFSFSPTPVKLTAQTWLATGPKGGAHLELTPVAGKHYFVELSTKQEWPVTKMFGIKEISCEQARDEHEHDKPLEKSHIKSKGVSSLVAESSFSACSQP
jgi:hypothetical protein